MSIRSEVNRIKGNVSSAFQAIAEKGGTVPSSLISGNLAAAIATIPTGGGSTVQIQEGIVEVIGGFFGCQIDFAPDYVFFKLQDSTLPASSCLDFTTPAEDDYRYTSLIYGNAEGIFVLVAWLDEEFFLGGMMELISLVSDSLEIEDFTMKFVALKL